VKQWGQNGIICTDGGAFNLLLTAHKYYPDLATAASACLKAGITMFLDNYRKSVEEALSKKMITEEEINAAIRCNLRVLLKLGLLDNSPKNPYSGIGVTDSIKPWTKPESHDLAYQATVKSIVLLKNEGKILPVQKDQIKTVAVIGPSANMVISDWYGGKPPYTVSALQGIRKAAGDNIEVLFAQSNKADSAVIAAKKADIAIVCIGNDPLGHNVGWGKNYVPGEGREDVDRQAITIEQEDLVKLVMAANPKTVLVLISSFPYAINWSKEHVPAILHMTQSSQELGNGLADVLFGKQNPAGRLTQTWSASIDELLPILDYNLRDGRTYMYDKHTPLFPFGYGLSYTTFEYSAVQTDKKVLKDGQTLNVTFKLKNTGNSDGEEVVQLYASYPGSQVARPIKQLRAFHRVFVPKGQTVDVTLPLKAEDLKYWDVNSSSFILEKGNVHFFIGGSSVDERISGDIEVMSP
jgi:beta-glucosidase